MIPRGAPGFDGRRSARMVDEWLTPPEITDALGRFDLDPCSPPGGWVPASRFYTQEDDGLTLPWSGRVWLNPPYSDVDRWMARLADHRCGTALVFARTETRWWFDSVWQHASALLFLRGRLTFYRGDRTRSKSGQNSGGPSVLIAYGNNDASILGSCVLDGAFVDRRPGRRSRPVWAP